MGLYHTSLVLEPDTRANQPAAADVPIGALYCVTDEDNIVERNNGSSWDAFSPAAGGAGGGIYAYSFVDPVLGDFTSLNTPDVFDDSNGGIFLQASAQSGEHVKGAYKSAPGTPYTIEAAFLIDFIRVDNPVVGIGFRNSGSGKMAICAVQNHSGMPNLMSGKYDSVTSYAGDYVRQPTSLGTQGQLIFLRITDDAANRICEYSVNGFNWHTLHTVGRTDHITADQVMFYANAINGSWDAAIHLLSWKEIT